MSEYSLSDVMSEESSDQDEDEAFFAAAKKLKVKPMRNLSLDELQRLKEERTAQR